MASLSKVKTTTAQATAQLLDDLTELGMENLKSSNKAIRVSDSGISGTVDYSAPDLAVCGYGPSIGQPLTSINLSAEAVVISDPVTGYNGTLSSYMAFISETLQDQEALIKNQQRQLEELKSLKAALEETLKALALDKLEQIYNN